jgi:hypothetical protein
MTETDIAESVDSDDNRRGVKEFCLVSAHCSSKDSEVRKAESVDSDDNRRGAKEFCVVSTQRSSNDPEV